MSTTSTIPVQASIRQTTLNFNLFNSLSHPSKHMRSSLRPLVLRTTSCLMSQRTSSVESGLGPNLLPEAAHLHAVTTPRELLRVAYTSVCVFVSRAPATPQRLSSPRTSSFRPE